MWKVGETIMPSSSRKPDTSQNSIVHIAPHCLVLRECEFVLWHRGRERERYHSRIVFYCVVVLNLNCVVVGLPLLTDWALLASWVVLRGMQTMIWCEARSGSERDRHKPKKDSLQRSIVFLFFYFFVCQERKRKKNI